MSGTLYRLRAGCQWDAIPSEFGSRSAYYRRFVEWTKEGVFRMMHLEMLLYYDEERGIEWAWASLDSALGTKRHVVTDGRGVMLGVTAGTTTSGR